MWRQQGLRALPAQTTLDRLATVTGTPYERVLGAALVDAGYLREGQSISVSNRGVNEASSAQTITGQQLRDLYREDFGAWTGTSVSITDAHNRFIAKGSLVGFALALPEDPAAAPAPFYSLEPGEHYRWNAADRCTLYGAHPPIPAHGSGGRSGNEVTVSELRMGDCVTTWRGNGLRSLRVIGLSPATDEWGDVRIDFIDVDSGERITHPNMRYDDTYTSA